MTSQTSLSGQDGINPEQGALERCEAAQLNLYRQAEHNRHRRRELEDAFHVLAPWIAKFTDAAAHYDKGAPRFKGSRERYAPRPGYESLFTPYAFAEFPGSPLNGPTVGDLRMLRDAFALVKDAITPDINIGEHHVAG